MSDRPLDYKDSTTSINSQKLISPGMMTDGKSLCKGLWDLPALCWRIILFCVDIRAMLVYSAQFIVTLCGGWHSYLFTMSEIGMEGE